MMLNQALLSLVLLCSCQVFGVAAEAFDPRYRFWYSADGNHWTDGQLQTVQSESDGVLAVVLKRADGSITRQIRVDKLSEADSAFVNSALKLRTALGKFSESEFIGAVAEVNRVRTGMSAGTPYFRGLSADFFSTELIEKARARARFGEFRQPHQDYAPNFGFAEFNNNHAQFRVGDVRYSETHAGIEAVTVVTERGYSVNVTLGQVSQIRLLPDWLPTPNYRVKEVITSPTVLVSERGPHETLNGEGYLLLPNANRKIWTTTLESEAYEKLDTSNRLWFDALELERPFAVRRLVKMGDQFCDARDFKNGIRAYQEAIRLGKPRPDIQLRLAYAEFGQGVDTEGIIRRDHYSRAKGINQEVSASAEATPKILLSSRYLGAWIEAGIGGENTDDLSAFESFGQALQSAESVAPELSKALSEPDVGADVSPALRIFLLAKTSGLKELETYARANMAKRCNRRMIGTIDRWIALRERPSFSEYGTIIKELEIVRQISFGQKFIDLPAWELSTRCASEGGHHGYNSTVSHEMHQDAVSSAAKLAAQLGSELTCDNYLNSKNLTNIDKYVAEFLIKDHGSDPLQALVQKRGRSDMCLWLTRAQATAIGLQENIGQDLNGPGLKEIPHAKWSETTFSQQHELVKSIESRMDSLKSADSEALQCQEFGRKYDYKGRARDIVDNELMAVAPELQKQFLRRATRFHAAYSAFWNEQDKYYDSLFFLTRSANTQNQLIALESSSPSDR